MQWIPISNQVGQVVFQDLESWDATNPLRVLRVLRVHRLHERIREDRATNRDPRKLEASSNFGHNFKLYELVPYCLSVNFKFKVILQTFSKTRLLDEI